jgi:predicted transcriptional regulator
MERRIKPWMTKRYDERLRRIREQGKSSRFTLADFAQKTGIPLKSVCSILSGRKQGSPECLRIFELILNLREEEIISDEEKVSLIQPEEMDRT